MKILVKHVDALIGGKLIKDRDILISRNISKIERGGTISPDDNTEIIDCENKNYIIAAGYIDIHTHGGLGHDCIEATKESFEQISRYHLLSGTTTYLATTVTSSIDALQDVINTARLFKEDNIYSRLYGLHLEGPFLSPQGAGAQTKEHIISPNTYNTAFIFNASDIVKRVTVAPDVKSVDKLTKKLTQLGVQVSAGHDNSIHTEIEECMKQGLNSVTHLFNCTSRAARRGGIEKYLGLTETALLKEELYVEIIADGVHVPYGLIELAYKNKGMDKICIVSDSLSVSGVNKSPLYLGKEKEGSLVEVKEGVCVLAGTNTLAGSVTPISKMVQNIIANTNIPLKDCLVMGTLSPSKLLDIKDRGDIQIGYLADLNILDSKGKIITSIFGGRIIGV